MILTGPFIEEQVKVGTIVIDPYDPKLVGPNSVDLRLHETMKIYKGEHGRPYWMWNESDFQGPQGGHGVPLDLKKPFPTRDEQIPKSGYILVPNTLYLGRTIERIGSKKFVPMVEGRSSCGRLGLQVHMTAGFCDTGFEGTITLEMTVVHPVRIYPEVPICQVFFLRPEGQIRLYEGRYQGHVDATPSRMHLPSEGAGRATLCSVCKEPQFSTPSGLVCKNGHGGAPSIEEEP